MANLHNRKSPISLRLLYEIAWNFVRRYTRLNVITLCTLWLSCCTSRSRLHNFRNPIFSSVVKVFGIILVEHINFALTYLTLSKHYLPESVYYQGKCLLIRTSKIWLHKHFNPELALNLDTLYIFQQALHIYIIHIYMQGNLKVKLHLFPTRVYRCPLYLWLSTVAYWLYICHLFFSIPILPRCYLLCLAINTVFIAIPVICEYKTPLTETSLIKVTRCRLD